MARNRKGWYACGCCPMTYTDVEVAKGSHYEIGDDDDVPYRKPGGKKRRGRRYPRPDTRCTAAKNHVFVWVKIMQQNYRESKVFSWGHMMNVRYAEPGEFINRYDFMCVGCGHVKKTTYPRPAGRRWWGHFPAPEEYEIYEVRHLDKYNNRI